MKLLKTLMVLLLINGVMSCSFTKEKADYCNNILKPTTNILNDLDKNKSNFSAETNTYIDSLMTKELYFFKKCK
jgi:hypothetical protein